MDYDINIVNSFTGEDAEGNPAGVMISREDIAATLMQEIAKRVGFSETAFVTPLMDKSNEYKIRWFTTLTEVPLCGHATLAAAAVIFQKSEEKPAPDQSLKKEAGSLDISDSDRNNKIRFHSQSGILEVFRQQDRFVLDFPLDVPVPYHLPENLLTAMSIDSYVSSAYGKLTNYLLIHLQNEEIVTRLSPNFQLLQELNLPCSGGIIVTALSDNPNYDFVSRFFAPWEGIMEDPVTGSAHSLLTPYWQPIVKKSEMNARQISSRGGILYLKAKDDRRVFIGGSAEIIGKMSISIIQAQ